MEGVKGRAKKFVPSLNNKGYEIRLREINLISLETRSLRGQLNKAFKIFRGFVTAPCLKKVKSEPGIMIAKAVVWRISKHDWSVSLTSCMSLCIKNAVDSIK